LNVEKLVVADDEVFGSEPMQAIYRMALPGLVDLAVMPVMRLESAFARLGELTSLVLIRTIVDAKKAIESGCVFSRIMLGNVHASPDRKRVTDAVYLSDAENEILCWMKNLGIEIEIQTFPGEVLRFVTTEGGCKWSKG
jgi:mannose/fructose/N-acetylgalactosamine-specific phosphotransferase system component IIB